MNSLGYIETQI